MIPQGAPPETSVYCFDLTFTPKTAVGSPHPNNSAVVATGTPDDTPMAPPSDIVDQECPSSHPDAVAHTYGSSDGTDAAINFQIVFE